MTSPSLRLALSSAQVNWGGGEQFLLSLGNQLAAKGHEVHWFTPKGSELANRIQQTGHPVHAFPARNPSPRDLLDLRSKFNKLKIQVFHANDPHALNWGSLSLLGLSNVRRVAVKHTIFPVRKPLKYNLLTDIVACVSHAVQQQCISDGIKASKTRVIYPGLEVPQLDICESRNSIRQDLGVAPDTIVFTAVGNLFECKAYDRLIEASAILRNHLSKFRIVICGEGPERERLELLIKKHDLAEQVKLLGFRKDANRWIAGSDAFVHPSLSEGLSLVAIEAQMLGIPVVAAKVGGLAEVLTAPCSGADLGWIVNDTTSLALSHSLLSSINSPIKRAELVELARIQAMNRFDVVQMAESFERTYMRLCSKAGRILHKIPSPSVA